MNKSKLLSACVLSFGLAGCASTGKSLSGIESYQKGFEDAEKYSLKFYDEYKRGYCEAIIAANKGRLRRQFESIPTTPSILLRSMNRDKEIIECVVKREEVKAKPVSPLKQGEYSI